jgi:hypothetical protein
MHSNCDATVLFNIADNTIDLLVKGLANPMLHLVQRIYTSISLFHFDVGKANEIPFFNQNKTTYSFPKSLTISNLKYKVLP